MAIHLSSENSSLSKQTVKISNNKCHQVQGVESSFDKIVGEEERTVWTKACNSSSGLAKESDKMLLKSKMRNLTKLNTEKS